MSPLPQKKSGEKTLLPIFFWGRGDVCTQAKTKATRMLLAKASCSSKNDDKEFIIATLQQNFQLNKFYCRLMLKKI